MIFFEIIKILNNKKRREDFSLPIFFVSIDDDGGLLKKIFRNYIYIIKMTN